MRYYLLVKGYCYILEYIVPVHLLLLYTVFFNSSSTVVSELMMIRRFD
jgi:hypothetical protein